MSLILDALKKAEAERNLGQVPSLHVQPLAILPADGTPSRTKKVRLGVAAVLMITAIVVLGWLRPWQKQVSIEPNRITQEVSIGAAVSSPSAGLPAYEVPPSAPQQIIAASPQPETYKPPVKPVAPAPKAQAASPRSTTNSIAASATTTKAAPDLKQRPTVPSATTKTAQADATATNTTAAALNSATANTGSKSLSRQPASQAQPATIGNTEQKTTGVSSSDVAALSPRELPEQIQRELPNLMIGGYIYSDNPRERQLLVNRRLLHEGEEAAPGVILEKMTPKAAVFNYRGYRYRMAY